MLALRVLTLPCLRLLVPARCGVTLASSLKARLFGTLVAVCHGDKAHSALLARDMHLSWLVRFIAKQRERDSTPTARLFASCFPRGRWAEAHAFFEAHQH